MHSSQLHSQNRIDRKISDAETDRLAGNTETGRHTGFPKIPCVTPCLGNSHDTVENIPAWKVIPKQAATRHIPKYPVSHPVSVIAITRLNL